MTEKRNKIIRRILYKLPFLLLIPLGICLPKLALANPALVETVYSRGLYPLISTLLGAVSSLFPFSLAECLIYLALLGLLVFLLAYPVLLLLRKRTLLQFANSLLSLIVAGGALFSLFYCLWGVQYARPKLSVLLHLPQQTYTIEDLYSLCTDLAADANRLRMQTEEDENGIFRNGYDTRTCTVRVAHCYNDFRETTPLFSQRVYPAKPILLSHALSYTDITGIYIPYTAEANINAHQPDLLLAATAAHESAHYIGIAREDEANFMAYLVCSSADDPAIAYSGTVLALIHAGNQLSNLAPELYAQIYATYSEALKRDLIAYNEYWAAYEGPVSEQADQLNDSYLKYNHQESGVQSYGEMVNLLLAYAAKQHQ